MPAFSPTQFVEAFHLTFLRILESKLQRSFFVVKGGVNLRAWFRSLRYSEDLDIDLLRGEVFEVREKVDAVLSGPALRDLLRSVGLTITRSSAPKQTATTQRWKIALAQVAGGTPLHTKVEFSRRGGEEDYALDPVLAEIVAPYGIPAPTVQHYTAAAALRQKIGALAGRREVQARDIWDLDHLLRTTRADPRPLPATTRNALPAALERVTDLPFEAFKAQVVPFLAPEHQEVFGTRESWQRMQELVIDRLLEIQG